jgi:hypothetical protein
MKLFHKSFLLISSFFVVSGIVAFAVTSCGSSNPYKDTRTGDNTSIKSKKDAGNLKNVAIDHIATQNPRNVSAAETNDLLFKTLTNGGIDYVYASTQVY